MKSTKVLQIVFLLLIICPFLLLSQKGRKDDNFGKIIGQIVDPDTGLPVEESFIISIYVLENGEMVIYPPKESKDTWDDSYQLFYPSFRTDKKGFFSVEFIAGIFKLHIRPESDNSKYCYEPFINLITDPAIKESYDFPIKVEKGKITRIKRKATIGGTLKMKIVDFNGNEIASESDFIKEHYVEVNLYHPYYPIHIKSFLSSAIEDTTDKISIVFKGLFPGQYSASINIQGGVGFGRSKLDNIVVKPGVETEKGIPVDINNKTGFEGYVYNHLGQPVTNATVFFHPKSEDFFNGFWTNTDKNGFYRIMGMKTDVYKFTVKTKEKRFFNTKDILLETKKDLIIRKDLNLID